MNKLITFDCYGTLIDTMPFYDEIGKVGVELGIDKNTIINTFNDYEDRLMYGEPFKKYTDLIYKTLEYCELELNCSGIKSNFDRVIDVHKNLSPYKEVPKTLNYLKEKGYKTALLSNSEAKIMDYNLKALNHNFDYVILAEDVGCYKPQIEFFNKVASEVNLNKNNHCHVAAGFWWDIPPASKLGWNKIWVNRKNKKSIDKYKPFEEVKTLDDIIKYV